MRRTHRGVRSPQAGLVGVLALAIAVLLPTAPLTGALGGQEPETSIGSASASLTFTGDGGSPAVPLDVDAAVEPVQVVDGGAFTATWSFTAPPADELAVDGHLAIALPVPDEVATVPEVDVVGVSGVDRAGWSIADDHLSVELALTGGAARIEATVVASMRLRAGVAPTAVDLGAPDRLTVDGQVCSPDVAVPSLVRVVVTQATTSTTTPATTSTTAPTTSTTRPWGGTDVVDDQPDDPAADGDAPSPPPIDPADLPHLPPSPDPSTASRVVTGDVGGAQVRLDGVRDDLAASDRAVEEQAQRSAAIARRQRHLAAEQEQLAAKVRHHRREVERLATAAYVAAVDAYMSLAATTDDVVVLGTALDQGVVSHTRLLERQSEVSELLREVSARRSDGWAALDRAKAERQALRSDLTDGEYQLATFELGGDLAITGFRFPVAGAHDFSDTWHAPRSGGRLHQGTDVFAAEGTPVRASERGVLARVGTDTLGGTKLWLVGESGTQYYYAHLSGYAPGVGDGRVVAAGEVVGYVGHTGNARTTPPHLHFEVHPAGGAAIDAYPMLRAADPLDPSPTDAVTGSDAVGSSSATATTTATTTNTPTTVAPTTPSTGGSSAGPRDATPVEPTGPRGPAGRARPEVASGWGVGGEVREGLGRPTSVAVAPDGTLAVADAAHDRIVLLEADGSSIRHWGGSGSEAGRFHEPRGVAIGPDGSIYVADAGNGRIQRFSPAGDLLGVWDGSDGDGDGALTRPNAVAVAGDGRVYVLDSVVSEVRVFAADGTPEDSWGGVGDQPGRFAEPGGLAIGSDGDVYVADTLNGRIQRLTLRGRFVDAWTVGVRRPVAVAVTEAGDLVVVDRQRGALRGLGHDGDPGPGWGRTHLGQARDVAFDGRGHLLVADPAHGRLVAYRWG